MDVQELKQRAAEEAVARVESGMVLGLGTGSTATFAARALARRLQEGSLHDIVGIPTSLAIENEARRLGLPLSDLDAHPVLDLTIDGADEVDPGLNLIKGGGGALLREKIVAQASRREIIIVDQGKLSDRLGRRWAVPVEVVPFGWRATARQLESLGARVVLRLDAEGTAFKTDQDNLILDCNFGPIAEPAALAASLCALAGVVEHGLFVGLASLVIAAGEDGVKFLEAEDREQC